MSHEIGDHSTLAGARALCEFLTDFWAARGYHFKGQPRMLLRAFSDEGRPTRYYVIKSNMVNGYPQARL